MLSEWERQALRLIEQQTEAEDPWFAAAMRRGVPDRVATRQRGHDVVAWTSALCCLLCLSLSLVGPGVLAGALAALACWLRPRRVG